MLLIGPPPHKDGGAWVTFDLMLRYMRKLPHLTIHNFDLPVHHPLYDENGAPGPLSHPRTIIGTLRAVTLIPRVDHVFFYGAIDVCFSYGLAFILCAKLFRKRSAVRITGGRAVFNTRLLPAFVRSACLVMARAADVILVQTEVARNDLPAGLRSKATLVRGFRPRPSPESPPLLRKEEGMKFVFVGRALSDRKQSAADVKGLEVLLDAVERIRTSPAPGPGLDSAEDIEMHVYGSVSPGMAERMRRTPGIIARGFMANERLRDALRQHDVLVFPSRYACDGHPGVVIEAFMAGLPVFASDLPGPSEIVHHEVNGLIVRTGDADALAAAMIRLAKDGALRRRLAAGARASAFHFDQDRVLPELVKALGIRLPRHRGSGR